MIMVTPATQAIETPVDLPERGLAESPELEPIAPLELGKKKHRWGIVAIALLILVAVAVWFFVRQRGSSVPQYRFVTVERGDLESTVTATGVLGAVTTVQVGTQVSGQVSGLFADFNAHVKKGQLIARIDPTLQQQAVRDAEAGVEKSRAEVAKAERDAERDQSLFDDKVLSTSDFATTKYNLAVARANAKSAQVALERAQRNLSYTSIYAPIDGVVVERNVDVGQTVAASLSAPQLFLIAQDLARMQILVSVDESDIGQVRQSQAVHFTVQAYPRQTFSGTVNQVRLQSIINQNVVNYTVVVGVDNPKGVLLPGMTATVSFEIGSATNVLLVPNAALRFRPPAGSVPKGSVAARTVTGTTAGRPRSSGDSTRRQPGDFSQIWFLDANNRLTGTRVRTGLTDGQRTVIEGAGVTEGMRIVTGLLQVTGATTTTTANPFQPAAPQRGGPRM